MVRDLITIILLGVLTAILMPDKYKGPLLTCSFIVAALVFLWR